MWSSLMWSNVVMVDVAVDSLDEEVADGGSDERKVADRLFSVFFTIYKVLTT